MHIILLSGGSGKRLWPLSNEVRSKQFLKIFRRADGSHESMLQRMYRMIRETDPGATVTIATSGNQVSAIRAQLGEEVGISVEPCRRDTFPAIALAAAFLHEKQGVAEDEAVLVCPVDPYVETDYFEMLGRLCLEAEGQKARLVLMGITPTQPSEKYGYIIPRRGTEDESGAFVECFREKPDIPAAEEYIRQGALWNAGIFAFRLAYMLEKTEQLLGTANYEALFRDYASLPKISFDYAVAEKEESIRVLRFSGTWEDLGTWNTLTRAMVDPVSGNAVAAECENTHVINELQIPLIALGVKNLAIAATPDGILVSDKEAGSHLKEYVVDRRPMYEMREWGEYRVLDYRVQGDGCNSLTKALRIFPGKHISYQRHRFRSEIWTVTEGEGRIILEDEVRTLKRGDTAHIRPMTRHALLADSELHIIEVQVGSELTEEDVERLDFDWSRFE